MLGCYSSISGSFTLVVFVKWYTGGGERKCGVVFFFFAVPSCLSIFSVLYILLSLSLSLCQPVLVLSHPSPAVKCHLLPVSHCTLRSCSGTKGSYLTLVTFGGNKANVLLLVYFHLYPLRDPSCLGASLIFPTSIRAVQNSISVRGLAALF